MIENKSVFWKTLVDKKCCLFQDLLDSQGNFLSFQGFTEKYSINAVNFLKYYQLISAIPQWLKHYALACTDLRQLQLPFESPVYQLSDDIVLDLNKIYYKQIYKLFVEKIDVEPTEINSWRKHSPEIADQWTTSIQNSYKITRDNKLRQFYFKLLHRILVTNKELKYFGITNATKCAMCDEFDSILNMHSLNANL